jgi:hypothetical protein
MSPEDEASSLTDMAFLRSIKTIFLNVDLYGYRFYRLRSDLAARMDRSCFLKIAIIVMCRFKTNECLLGAIMNNRSTSIQAHP